MKQSTQSFLMVLLLTLFIASSGLLIIFGSNFYTSMNLSIEQHLSKTSAVLYFNQRFKQQDQLNGFELKDQVLIFNQEGYYTLVYEVDGVLMEQVSDQALVDPLSASKITQVSDLQFSQERHQVTVSFTDESGQLVSLAYTLLSLEVSP